jgi:hypothetical protein
LSLNDVKLDEGLRVTDSGSLRGALLDACLTCNLDVGRHRCVESQSFDQRVHVLSRLDIWYNRVWLRLKPDLAGWYLRLTDR